MPNVLGIMVKRVVDLTAGELNQLAAEAWKAAAEEALQRGLPVTGSRDGRRFRYHPDGRVEDLGPVSSLPDDDNEILGAGASRKSVA
jgi:hypothetical protein